MKADRIIRLTGEKRAFLELVVKNRDGSIADCRKLPARSFLRQFMEMLWVRLGGPNPSTIDIRDTGGVMRAYGGQLYRDPFRVAAGTGVTTEGIIAGSGITAVTLDDSQIETLILHGTAAGRLQYGSVAVAHVADDGAVSQVTITRDFSNGSGAAVTVNELALYANDQDSQIFAIIRDVIPGGIAVQNGQIFTANYRIEGFTGDGILRHWIEQLRCHMVDEPLVNVRDIHGTYHASHNLLPFRSTVTPPGGMWFYVDSVMAVDASGHEGVRDHLTPRSVGTSVHGDTYGVQVGSGDTPVATDDFKLATRILHGTSAGRLIYEGSYMLPLVIGPAGIRMPLYRYFRNKSGGTVTIREVAIYLLCSRTASASEPVCIFRRVLPLPVTVNDDELLLVEYNLETAL